MFCFLYNSIFFPGKAQQQQQQLTYSYHVIDTARKKLTVKIRLLLLLLLSFLFTKCDLKDWLKTVQAVLYNMISGQSNASHLISHPRKVKKHAGHGWSIRAELISDVLLWTPTHGYIILKPPAKNYINQLKMDNRCSRGDITRINDW